MKNRKLFYIAALAMALFAVDARSQNLQYQITGKLENVSPMPTKVYLKELLPLGMLAKPTDSAEVKNGQYHFTGQLNVDEAIAISITSSLSKEMISLVVDKGNLVVTSTNKFDQYTVTGSGALANTQFDEMKGDSKRVTDSIRAVLALEVNKDNKELQKAMLKKQIDNSVHTILHMYNYLKTNQGKRIIPFGTLSLVAIPFLSQTGKDTLISLLPETVKADKLGQEIIKMNDKNKAQVDSARKAAEARNAATLSKVPLGSKAPEIIELDPKGNKVSLSSLKGKYVLIDFWASWCAPCRAENPNVVKAYQQYRDKGFTVFGVSLDGASTKTAWINAIEKDGLAWTQVSDLAGWSNAAAKAYEIKSIPQNFLLDPNGNVIAENLRGEDLQKKLASIFSK